MNTDPWWGQFKLAGSKSLCWTIDKRLFAIQHLPGVWNTWNFETDEEIEGPIIQSEREPSSLPEEAKRGRYMQEKSSDFIRILPALADRSVIARPAIPLTVLPDEQTRIFISIPLWFKAITLPGNSCILDQPFWRPSDSWFGPSNREGEMCYAKYTDARVQSEIVKHRPHRAITPISIINKHTDPLIIERLSVPVTLLSIFSDQDNQLWTESLTVTRGLDNETTEVELEKEAPEEAPNPELVSEPRICVEKRTLIRSISSIFA